VEGVGDRVDGADRRAEGWAAGRIGAVDHQEAAAGDGQEANAISAGGDLVAIVGGPLEGGQAA
jgi:hypothetical protein